MDLAAAQLFATIGPVSLHLQAPIQSLFTTPGCARSKSLEQGLHNHTIASGGLERNYLVNVPTVDGNPNNVWPLIVDFHGRNSNPGEQYENSRYAEHEGGHAYLTVFPAGVDGSWQGAGYADSDVDDLKFVVDLLDALGKEYCYDKRHVYASGKSNGAGFVNLLACSDEGDAFAAFGMASAALYTDNSRGACEKKRAIVESHGAEDKVIPFDGDRDGTGGQTPNIFDWASWWGQRNCGQDVEAENKQQDGYEVTSYSCGRWQDATQLYRVEKLGHCWPDTTGNNYDARREGSQGCGEDSLDFTSVLIDFFKRWNLGNSPR